MRLAGIWPAACMDLYCMGVMCSNPGGGTSQYREGLRLLVLGLRSLGDLDLLLSPLSLLRSLLLSLSLHSSLGTSLQACLVTVLHSSLGTSSHVSLGTSS